MNFARTVASLSVLLLPLTFTSLPATTRISQNTTAATTVSANPVIPGDHPDPTILRIDHTYWMASTSGDWAPAFSLFRSADLHHWSPAGAIFPEPPAWATGDFWAPELTSGPKGVYVFYAARKKGGPLCVAVANAPKPDGPYTDHGPLVCESDGSIDPSVVRDEHGHPFLVWKEDANSIQKPTVIWAQPLTADLLHLTGSKFELIRNDPQSWEGAVVEGPYIQRHRGRFFLFYAGNACCGEACHYAEGVARADHLRGPWTKDPANPIIHANGAWRCPGHGTAVTTPSGKDFFLYHAYPAAASVYLGRESVLDAITWSAQGWPVVDNGNGPAGDAEANLPASVHENFRSAQLDPEWKWPIGHEPKFHSANGELTIAAAPTGELAYLSHSLPSLNYEATVAVPPGADASSGLGLIGETTRGTILFRTGNTVVLRRNDGTSSDVLSQATIPADAILWLRISSKAGHKASFSYSTDQQNWMPLSETQQFGKMLAWDHGLRVGLVAQGTPGTQARFASFSLRALPSSF